MSRILTTPFLSNLKLVHQGKTRDTFACSDPDELLIVATNRISTHNVVHKSLIPMKGPVLTALTIFWKLEVLDKCSIKNHIISYGNQIYNHLPGSPKDYPPNLHYRAIVVKKLQMIPVEFIFRSYLCGSLYKNYFAKGVKNPYGIPQRNDMELMTEFSRPEFDQPVFTPTDKSETDEPLSSDFVTTKYPKGFSVARSVFLLTQSFLQRKGLEEVDGKFELGYDKENQLNVGDEIVTPDSTRLVKISDIKIGKEPPWYDKQLARNIAEQTWNGGEKVPIKFSEETEVKLSTKYQEIVSLITGMPLNVFQHKYMDL